MTDYGAAKAKGDRRKKILAIIGVAVVVVAGVAFLVWSNWESRTRKIATSDAVVAADSITGPPCEPGTAAGKLGRGDQWETLVFTEVEFGRRIGHADCAVAKDDSKSGFRSVCQFSSPAELRVVTQDGARHYFDVGLGQPATVIVSESGVQCVKAANNF